MDKSNGIGPRAREILKYIGPGILVTVGFIDPGNWASNVAAGASYGYALLWMVTLSTLMLIILQHNAAHLGIVTGLCISEAAEKFLPAWFAKPILFSGVAAAVATALAELLGAAIALKMLFHLPIKIGTLLTLAFVGWTLYSNSYRRLEKWIIGFVSIIGLAFIFELSLVEIDWPQAVRGWIVPSMPEASLPIVMSVLGAVVMPHNLFLHSEVIQSRKWNLSDDRVIQRQLRFEFLDTLFSMVIGWAINSAMILVAAATFFKAGMGVSELEQAAQMLDPLLGKAAALVFALALLFSGLASSVTAGMAGGSIFAGGFGEAYDISQDHTRRGVMITLGVAAILIFFISDPFKGLVYSQMLLSIQLPWTIFLQIRLTSSKAVMGKYKNLPQTAVLLWVIGAIVTGLNVMLLMELLA
jgi:manganese transport protein